MRNTVPLGVILASAFSLLSGLAAAQSNNVHHFTTQPAGSRFEIVQSPIAAKWTFRPRELATTITHHNWCAFDDNYDKIRVVLTPVNLHEAHSTGVNSSMQIKKARQGKGALGPMHRRS